MQIAIISRWFSETTIPLAYYLAKNHNVKVVLYYIVYRNENPHPVVEFNYRKLKYGVNKISTKNTIPELLKYVDNTDLIFNIVCYPKFASFFNYFNRTIERVMALYIGRRINKIKCDILHIIGEDNRLLPFCKLKLENTLTVNTFHEAYKSSDSKGVGKILEHVVLNKIPTIFHSDNVLKRIYPDFWSKDQNVAVIPFGPFENYLEYCQPTNQKTIEAKVVFLWFGRILPYKGLDLFIKASRELINDNRISCKIHFIIAGKGKFREAELLSDQDHYTVINRFINSWELSNLLNTSSVVVCTHLSASQSGIPMTAYAFTKPVICSNVDGIKHMVIDGVTGFLYERENYKELAERMRKFVEQPNEITRYSKNIGKYTSTGMFSWNEIAKKTLSFYTNLMLIKAGTNDNNAIH